MCDTVVIEGDVYASGEDAVGVRRSHVCSGDGVFALRDIPEGVVVARYAGVYRRERAMVTRAHRRLGTEYTYQLSGGGGWEVVGEPSAVRAIETSRAAWRAPSKGRRRWVDDPCTAAAIARLPAVGHLLNDALHEEVSGRDNNCEFKEVACETASPAGIAVVIVTARDVAAGEELLVAYGLAYWTYRARSDTRPAAWPAELAHWLSCHARFEDAVRRAVGSERCFLHAYEGTSEPDKAGLPAASMSSQYHLVVCDGGRPLRCGCDARAGRGIGTGRRDCRVRLTLASGRDMVEEGEEVAVRVACVSCGGKVFV